ncbi:MAG: zinc ribbon domain-containing protein [Acidobacteriota bacterium]|nr:zinc ribbon domain-containing protein [Acidobacteriota bacterium]
MYCPNCATPIDDSQKFCRACGANVSLIPQALSGKLPVAVDEEENFSHGRRKHRKAPSIEKAAGNFFSGLGFVVAALFVTFWFPGGHAWGWSFFFPAFALIGEGVGQYLKVKEMERQRLSGFLSTASPRKVITQAQPLNRIAEPSTPTTSAPRPPQSITEHTTKHLGSNQ